MRDSSDKSAMKIDFRTFFILILLAAVPMIIGSWWLFSSYESQNLEMVGTSLSGRAETAFSAINGYLQNQIIEIAGLAEVPDLQAPVDRGNQDLKRNLDEVRKEITKTEGMWPSLTRDSPQVKAILENPTSKFLRRYCDINKPYREIIVTDFLGRVVAATDKPRNHYYALADWWKETYGDGMRGSVYIGDVHYDSEAKAYFMDLAQPLVQQGTGVVGAIKVMLDLQGIYSLVGSFEAGLPGTAVILIHAKGDVISAPGYSSLEQRTYPATLDILSARERSRRYLVSRTDPPAIYGLTQRSFQQMYPHLNWIVAATRELNEVVEPQRQLRRYFIALQLGIILATLAAILMLSRVESRPTIEEDPHLEKL